MARALKILGPRLLAGFDIGCSFSAMLDYSSLGEQFKASLLRCCINTFHGYSHNYSCQAQNHPNNIEGMGLEDLEGMEQIFSRSNQLASVVRYASAYRRQQFIDPIYNNGMQNNYLQATKIIDEETLVLEHAMQSLGIASTEELDCWQAEELEYLQTLGKEDDYNVMTVAYVERLQELNEIRKMSWFITYLRSHQSVNQPPVW